MQKRLFAIAGTVVWLGLTPAPGLAQQYPNKEIQVILPVGSGPTDILARTLMPCVSDRLKQPIVMVNKPGAGTEIGSAIVKNSKPDGYTILFATSALVTDLATKAKPTFDIRTDLAPISKLAYAVQGVFVSSALNVNTLPEFINYVKANPGKVNYGSIAPGSVSYLITEALAASADLKMVHIPFAEGINAIFTSLMANEIQLATNDLAGGAAAVESGKARLLAVVSKDRLPSKPNVPTTGEIVPGMADHYGYAWYGLMAPVGTPKDIIDRWYAETKTCFADPAVLERLTKLGYERTQFALESPEEFGRRTIADVVRLQDLAKKANMPLR